MQQQDRQGEHSHLGQYQQEGEEAGKEVREITLLSLLNMESHYAPQNLKWVHSNLKSLSLRNLGIGITQSAGIFSKKLGKDKCRSDHPRDGERLETSPGRRTSSVEGTKSDPHEGAREESSDRGDSYNDSERCNL